MDTTSAITSKLSSTPTPPLDSLSLGKKATQNSSIQGVNPYEGNVSISASNQRQQASSTEFNQYLEQHHVMLQTTVAASVSPSSLNDNSFKIDYENMTCSINNTENKILSYCINEVEYPSCSPDLDESQRSISAEDIKFLNQIGTGIPEEVTKPDKVRNLQYVNNLRKKHLLTLIFALSTNDFEEIFKNHVKFSREIKDAENFYLYETSPSPKADEEIIEFKNL